MLKYYLERLLGRKPFRVRKGKVIGKSNNLGIRLFYLDIDHTRGFLEYGRFNNGEWISVSESRREFRKGQVFGTRKGGTGSRVYRYGEIPFELQYTWTEVSFHDYQGSFHRLLIKIPIKVMRDSREKEMSKYH